MERMLSELREAAFDPSCWSNAQKEMQSYMDSIGCQLASVNLDNTVEFSSKSTIDGLDEALKSSAPNSEPVAFAVKNPNWRIFSDYDYISESDIDKSEFYSENQRYGLKYRLALRLVDDPYISVALLFFFSKTQGHAQTSHVEKLKKLAPYAQFAAYANSRILTSKHIADSVLDMADTRTQPCLAVDATARIVRANGAFDEFMGTTELMFVSNGCLRASLTFCDRTLAAAIEKATTAVYSAESIGTSRVPLGRENCGARQSAWVMPLPQRYQFLGRTRPLAIVQIEREGPISDDPAKLIAAFGLTPAEARLAIELWKGSSPNEYADHRGVSRHTVRNQIKSIFDKVDVRRQSALVAKIATALFTQ